MDVDLIFKIAAIGILVAVLDMILVKADRKDQALLTGIAGLIVVLVIVLKEISGLFDTIRNLFGL
ncbi:MAG: stage III sporulation protein AC [Oscillospiraceae bacterium]|nr:stage III sporulation protein AC [Oscillospiraceae bacterium]